GAGLKKGTVYVWKSTEENQFIEQEALQLENGSVEMDLEPDALYTLTSTTGQQKGSYGTPPERKPFPFPYEENFDNYTYAETPRYFADQKGTFETARSPRGGMCLAQIVPEQGVMWGPRWVLKPHSLFGDPNWNDYAIEADVLLAGGDAEVGGRYADRNKLGFRWILTSDGRWQLNWQYTTLASGQIVNFKPAEWHHLRLEMKGDQITGFIDGKELANVSNQSGFEGMAVIASTYDRNLFDNIKVEPVSTQ
ncbi:MAG: hypothetical protein ACQESL_07585, partial [Bacteroidota bacterium]